MDMDVNRVAEFASNGLNLLGSLFLVAVGMGVLAVIALFFIDITQNRDAVRKNYPVIGRFRTVFSHLGEFFRQYFFALDREEMPFNRAQRDWVNGVCEHGTEVIPFGSTNHLNEGAPIFANGMFPAMEDEMDCTNPILIGPDTPHPYTPKSWFNISAMSYGSLSAPAIRALSKGAAKAGCYMNSGEGGISPYHLEGGCDLVYQLGTAKFGARNDDATLNEDRLRKLCENPNLRMVEIKLSQGAKPGKGGILPAAKVDADIAEIRGIPEGEAAISPNRHVDAGNPEELLDLIDQVRRVSGRPTGIKMCIGNPRPVREFVDAVVARGPASAPDFITIDGGDGGTGASPQPLIDSTGLTVRESLPLMDDMLRQAGLRERVVLIASGKLITSSDAAWALCAGADMVNSGRGFMFALGCIQALKCHKNTCPTGITTHDRRLQKGLDPTLKSERVANYVVNMKKEVEIIAHACGVNGARGLNREHVRIMEADGTSISFEEAWRKDHKSVRKARAAQPNPKAKAKVKA